MDGRTALVVGAAGGIGRAIADGLTGRGHRVAYADRGAPTLDQASDRVMALPCDATDPVAVDTAITRVEAAWGPVEVLVYAAGVLRTGSIVETTDDDLAAMLEVNVAGAFRCVRRTLPGMRRGGWGRILLVASAAGLTGGSPGLAGYATSKGAVLTLTKAVAREAAEDGITVNALAPAMIETPMIAGLYEAPPPVGRVGTPADVTHLALALLAEEAGYITGEIVGVDGGFRLP